MDCLALRLEVHLIFMQEPAMASQSVPRSIDHLVLPVKEVDDARARYEALGFTVAPTGQHPFGTENCCIFIADGTFLEPLAIANRETSEAAAIKGNTFIRNDQTYRFRVGDEGFSHLVLKTEDATADHRLYRQSGMSGGKQVRFGRKFNTPDGKSSRVSFK
ncbi:MAG: VOC family protein, partial [Rhizobiaceae bacterium]